MIELIFSEQEIHHITAMLTNILEPTVTYKEDTEEMKDDVIKNSRAFAYEALNTIDKTHPHILAGYVKSAIERYEL